MANKEDRGVSESDLSPEERSELMETRSRGQRRMAWLSLIVLILIVIFVFFIAPFKLTPVEMKAYKELVGVAIWPVALSLAGVISAFIGTSIFSGEKLTKIK